MEQSQVGDPMPVETAGRGELFELPGMSADLSRCAGTAVSNSKYAMVSEVNDFLQRKTERPAQWNRPLDRPHNRDATDHHPAGRGLLRHFKASSAAAAMSFALSAAPLVSLNAKLLLIAPPFL